MFGESRVDLAVVRAPRQRDSIRDVESQRLARLLDSSDQLARKARTPEFVVDVKIEGDRLVCVTGDRPPFAGRLCHDDVVGVDVFTFTIHHERKRTSGTNAVRQGGGLNIGYCLGDKRRVFPEALSQFAEVRFDHDVHQPAFLPEDLNDAHVEFIGNLGDKFVGELRPAGCGHEGARKRLPRLDAARGPGRPSEFDDSAHECHVVAQVIVDGRVLQRWPGREVHGYRRLIVGCSEQVLPHAFGNKRCVRGQAQSDGAESFVESGQCGLVSIPETSARAAYVPIGEIVDVFGEYPAAALGIEIVQGVVHIPRDPRGF